MYGISAFLRSRASRSKVVWILDTRGSPHYSDFVSAAGRACLLFLKGFDAPCCRGEVIRIDLETDEAPAVPAGSHGRGAAAHERIEHGPARRRACQHHAFDDLERLLRRMVCALRILAVQPRHAPQILGVVADLEPLLADENRSSA